MEIRTSSLDPGLTVAEIDPGTEGAWHFLPFEDRRAELFQLDERYVLALGSIGSLSHGAAIFDRVERRRTNMETNPLLHISGPAGSPPTWCYAPLHNSVFVIEMERKSEGLTFFPSNHLRQLSVDGRVNRRILVAPEFSAHALAARDDGRIVCVGFDQIAVFDPATGDSELSARGLLGAQGNFEHTQLRWFSGDGRWALRPHLGSLPRSGPAPLRAGRAQALLSTIFGRKPAAPQDEEEHPDLPGDGIRRFGLALDLFRLDPFVLERRLVVRYYTEEELYPGVEGRAQAVARLDELADRQDHRSWNGRDQLFLTGWKEDDETRTIRALLGRFRNVEWDRDSGGFTVSLWAGEREVPSPLSPRWPDRVTDLALRHVSLDGRLGPIALVPGQPRGIPPCVSEEAMSGVRAMVRERSMHRVDCAGWTGAGVASALREMRRMIEEDGLDRLVFGDQLQFRVRIDGRTIGEKKFFEEVRRMPPEEIVPVLPELRQLLRSYGSAARKSQSIWFRHFASGPSEHSPAAMSEAALTLAMLDDSGFDSLRDWVVTVDQEFDHFADARVFPAMARRTGFATAEAVRFGLWFFLQQWQTVRYQKSWLGLFKAAPAVMTPAAFAAAALEEARDVDGFSTGTSIGSGLGKLQDMLGNTFWDRAVSAELDRMLDALEESGNG